MNAEQTYIRDASEPRAGANEAAAADNTDNLRVDAIHFAGSTKKALSLQEISYAARSGAPSSETSADSTGTLNMPLLRSILDPNYSRVPVSIAKPMDYARLKPLGWNQYSSFLVDRIVTLRFSA
jgi:hypothetical protein